MQIWVERRHERARYTVLYAPKSATWSERSGEVQKIFFVLIHFDRLLFVFINLFFVLKNGRGVRGEFYFFKTPYLLFFKIANSSKVFENSGFRYGRIILGESLCCSASNFVFFLCKWSGKSMSI